MSSFVKMRCGWIRSIRRSKKIIFLAVTDGQEDYQLTVKKDTPIKGEPKVGASFIAQGVDSTTPRGFYEFLVEDLEIVGSSDDDFPIQPKEHSNEFLRSIPELRGRTSLYQGIWRIRHKLWTGLQFQLDREGFVQYWAPIITSADCEGAGETFSAESDWLKESLTVSAQLHGEVGMMSLGKVYTFGPCFRAEKSITRKHLSEFWMLEPEAAFYDLKADMNLAEECIRWALHSAKEWSAEFDKMRITTDHIDDVMRVEWPRITYSQVCEKYDLQFGNDLGSEIEKRLVRDFSAPVFVTHWPKDLKPFYMKEEDGLVECFDLIFPSVGELVGGSVREEQYDKLKKTVEETGINTEKMEWYLKTRKWGTVPHAGFGLGFERLVMFVCQLEKVHDAIPFPVHY